MESEIQVNLKQFKNFEKFLNESIYLQSDQIKGNYMFIQYSQCYTLAKYRNVIFNIEVNR